jgi:hypothetical protein
VSMPSHHFKNGRSVLTDLEGLNIENT